MTVQAFFAYARERHCVYLRRAAGAPRSEWTSDPILQKYRFCNVFRELDRTTIWFRDHVRDSLKNSPDVLLATILFRWFNRIVTGEAIFSQLEIDRITAWDKLRGYGPAAIPAMEASVRRYCGKGPYVTGSYIIKTPDGMDKLRGVLWCVEQFMNQEHPYPTTVQQLGAQGWRDVAEGLLADRTWDDPLARWGSLEATWDWLRKFPYLGDFMAYEIVTDLRHTYLLDRAPDIMTWANPGPGAMRGLNRIHSRPLDGKVSKARANAEMQELLALSKETEHWDLYNEHCWPAWEMREVEHTLCEFDKYERARLDEGRPRQVLR